MLSLLHWLQLPDVMVSSVSQLWGRLLIGSRGGYQCACSYYLTQGDFHLIYITCWNRPTVFFLQAVMSKKWVNNLNVNIVGYVEVRITTLAQKRERMDVWSDSVGSMTMENNSFFNLRHNCQNGLQICCVLRTAILRLFPKNSRVRHLIPNETCWDWAWWNNLRLKGTHSWKNLVPYHFSHICFHMWFLPPWHKLSLFWVHLPWGPHQNWW